MEEFIREMMEIGVWEDRAGSKEERDNAIEAGKSNYR